MILAIVLRLAQGAIPPIDQDRRIAGSPNIGWLSEDSFRAGHLLRRPSNNGNPLLTKSGWSRLSNWLHSWSLALGWSLAMHLRQLRAGKWLVISALDAPYSA